MCFITSFTFKLYGPIENITFTLQNLTINYVFSDSIQPLNLVLLVYERFQRDKVSQLYNNKLSMKVILNIITQF